jgi:hypothetical protein
MSAWERLRRWDTRALPLACDLLVYSLEEWRTLPLVGGGDRKVEGCVVLPLITSPRC